MADFTQQGKLLMKIHRWAPALAVSVCATIGLNAHSATAEDDPAKTQKPAEAATAPGGSVPAGNQGGQPAGTGIGGSSGSTGGHDEAARAPGTGSPAPSAQSDRAQGTGPGGDAGISAHEAQAITDGATATPDAPAGAVQENSIEKEKREADSQNARRK